MAASTKNEKIYNVENQSLKTGKTTEYTDDHSDQLNVSKPKLTKSEKKLQKQVHKKRQALLKHDGIETVEFSTKILYVANGGIDNGVTYDTILSLFSSYGNVLDVVMMQGKSYSFVMFENQNDAIDARSKLNGHELQNTGPNHSDLVANTNIILYVSFVENITGKQTQEKDIPSGLVLIPNFIDEEYETKLLNSINWSSGLIKSESSSAPEQSLKHRKVQHYGYEFLYGINNVDTNKPLSQGIPQECDSVIDNIMSLGYIDKRPNQLTVNQYEPGQGIPSHVDTHSAFEDGIISLSLGSDIVMEFKHPNGRHVPVVLPKRSLLIMTGESRYVWKHGITPRKSDTVPVSSSEEAISSEFSKFTLQKRQLRTSFTFRVVLEGDCDCKYIEQCDSKQKELLPQSDKDAVKLEQSHVHQVYDEIASHFSDTRHTAWPKIVTFLKSLSPFSTVVDVGCGNGKYLGSRTDLFMFGNDRSENLAEICAERGFQVFICDILSLPLKSESCDACICIAVVHHLCTEERRQSAIRELIRVVRKGGLILISVWALEQELHKVKSSYLKEITQGSAAETSENVENILECDKDTNLPVHVNRTQFKKQDVLVPWHLKKKSDSDTENVHHRFYHVFKQGELEELCQNIASVDICESYYDKGNWCVILQKQ